MSESAEPAPPVAGDSGIGNDPVRCSPAVMRSFCPRSAHAGEIGGDAGRIRSKPAECAGKLLAKRRVKTR